MIFNAIINFMSNRWNLTIFQCILYGIMGYVMGQYLNWIQLGGMLVIMYLIQIIIRTKAVADGMMIRQMMMDNHVDANEIIKQMKQEMDRLDKHSDLN